MKFVRFVIAFCVLVIAFQVRTFNIYYGYMFNRVDFNIIVYTLFLLSILLTVVAVKEESD